MVLLQKINQGKVGALRSDFYAAMPNRFSMNFTCPLISFFSTRWIALAMFANDFTGKAFGEVFDFRCRLKGSRKNKFAFLGVEAPVWQGAKGQEYRDISVLWQHSQAGCIGA